MTALLRLVTTEANVTTESMASNVLAKLDFVERDAKSVSILSNFN